MGVHTNSYLTFLPIIFNIRCLQKNFLIRDMSLLLKVKGKIKNILHKYLLGHLGFGNRVSKQVWEQQFGSGTWDYLTGKDEEAHYNKIVDFYKKLNGSMSILDVGCGKGVLYHYLNKNVNIAENRYAGIDISKNAVDAASQKFPSVKFKQVDFEYNDVEGKYGVIIFNETLYYFTRPLKRLEKCVIKNLSPNGCFIISMCHYANHELIWKNISKQYKTIFEDEVRNDKNQKWKIKLVQPFAYASPATAT